MDFYRIEDKKPEHREIVLVKIKDYYTPPFYVCQALYDYDEFPLFFLEADGESYYGYEPKEIEGWCPISEIEKSINWVK